jgi:hypothetical protein
MAKARIAFHMISFINFLYKKSKSTSTIVAQFNAARFTRILIKRVKLKRELKLTQRIKEIDVIFK